MEDITYYPTLFKVAGYKNPRFIANFSCCKATELSKLLTSILTPVKNMLSSTVKKVYERYGKNLFWYIKNSGEI